MSRAQITPARIDEAFIGTAIAVVVVPVARFLERRLAAPELPAEAASDAGAGAAVRSGTTKRTSKLSAFGALVARASSARGQTDEAFAYDLSTTKAGWTIGERIARGQAVPAAESVSDTTRPRTPSRTLLVGRAGQTTDRNRGYTRAGPCANLTLGTANDLTLRAELADHTPGLGRGRKHIRARELAGSAVFVGGEPATSQKVFVEFPVAVVVEPVAALFLTRPSLVTSEE
jgi:hypothetical protein